ncbi:MAG: hypothetical protein AAGI69_11680 [Cyanobacteria bacterium P01_H01_bin.21]
MVDTEGAANESAQSTGESELFERLQAFSLDIESAEMPFSKRLARDNGWPVHYARRVIDEYKKFAFLAVVADHPVTPSDQIDQVWHLHLTYTHSYWEDFCSQVLQTPLHHEPTLGGDDENQKFDEWYRTTLESYEQFFDVKPPADIWPPPEERFGRDSHFVRTNTQQNWILPKLQVWKGITASGVVLVSLVLSVYYLSSFEETFNPFAALIWAVVIAASGFGATRMVWGIVDFIQNPSRPSLGYYSDTIGFIGGCGGSHHSSGCGGSGCGSSGCGSG